jgi:hypothetical protein
MHQMCRGAHAMHHVRSVANSQLASPPVRAPVNFQMALNARTAKALGLTVPPSILLLADEVIQQPSRTWACQGLEMPLLDGPAGIEAAE